MRPNGHCSGSDGQRFGFVFDIAQITCQVRQVWCEWISVRNVERWSCTREEIQIAAHEVKDEVQRMAGTGHSPIGTDPAGLGFVPSFHVPDILYSSEIA